MNEYKCVAGRAAINADVIKPRAGLLLWLLVSYNANWAPSPCVRGPGDAVDAAGRNLHKGLPRKTCKKNMEA